MAVKKIGCRKAKQREQTAIRHILAVGAKHHAELIALGRNAVGKLSKSKAGMDITTDAEIDAALKRARAHDSDPLARTVKYVADHDLLMIGLSDGRRLILPLEDLPELKGLTKKQFENYELLGRGIAIHFPDIDVALPINGILDGTYGHRRWMAEMGAKGGQAKTKAKAEAARRNGVKGGRPRTAAKKAVARIAATKAVTRSARYR